jgi:hypothetical protein
MRSQDGIPASLLHKTKLVDLSYSESTAMCTIIYVILDVVLWVGVPLLNEYSTRAAMTQIVCGRNGVYYLS